MVTHGLTDISLLHVCYGTLFLLQQIQHPTASLIARVCTAQVSCEHCVYCVV